MPDGDLTALVAALADASNRSRAASALASRLGADALLIFVHDLEVDELLPAPGLPQTFAGGPTWRAFLQQCRVPGLHSGTVMYPIARALVPALACVGSSVAMVFVGGTIGVSSVEPIAPLLPLIGATLTCQQMAVSVAGELAVAREDARLAATLARSLDAARTDLERQTKSLVEAQGRAEDAARAKDEFLAMLGHELRNPLAPIVTALQMLRTEGRTSREQDILERQVAHLMRLVDDLLDVSRIAGGKVELRKERIEIATIAARAIEIAGPLFERKSQELVVEIAASGLAVDADPDRLTQVFSNLLANAAKYSDQRTRIVFMATREGDNVIVCVKDQGSGIDPQMLDKVFDLFTQQRQSIERSQGGLGLGLAIVKNLVLLHGGSVRAESEGRDMGSVFVVELPASTGASQPRKLFSTTLPGVRLARSSKRILVVDDNEDAAELLSLGLINRGYIVGTAADGPSALRVAQDFKPNVAVVDIGLPVMDGYELATRLRAEFGDALQLVALTGYGHASDRKRSRQAGFDAHLVKPIVLAQLQELLDQLPVRPEGDPAG